jgi:hypothetical protein
VTLPPATPYALGLWQTHIERMLAGWVGEPAVQIYRGHEVTGTDQGDSGGRRGSDGEATDPWCQPTCTSVAPVVEKLYEPWPYPRAVSAGTFVHPGPSFASSTDSSLYDL